MQRTSCELGQAPEKARSTSIARGWAKRRGGGDGLSVGGLVETGGFQTLSWCARSASLCKHTQES